MTPEQDERFVAAVEKIAEALKIVGVVHAQRFKKEFPAEVPKRAAKVFRNDDDKREQNSDRPTERWLAETEAALPKSRFAERFENESQAPKGGAEKRSGTRPAKGKA